MTNLNNIICFRGKSLFILTVVLLRALYQAAEVFPQGTVIAESSMTLLFLT